MPAGSGLPSSGSIGSSSAAVREASVPSANSFSQPNRARSDARPERVAAPQAGLRRRLELLLADAGVDPERELAALVERAVRGDARAQPLLERQGAGIVDRDDAEPHEVRGERGDESLVALRRELRGVDRHESGGGLVEDAGRLAGVVAPDQAAVGVRRVAGRCRQSASDALARPERVVVVGPDRDAPAGHDGLEVVGRRPAPEAVRVPAVALDPLPSVAAGFAGRPDRPRAPSGSDGDLRQVDLLAGDPALGEVEVGVGQARDRDLVGVELEPDRERVGPGLELDRRPGERDPAAA